MTDFWPPLHRNIDIEQYDIDATHPSNMLLPPPMPRTYVQPLLVVLAFVAGFALGVVL